MRKLDLLKISGKGVLPLFEGGKGISITNGESAGAWAATGGIGTFSGVNADSYDEDGNFISQIYKGKTRNERHRELIDYAVNGSVYQAKKAYETSNGEGRIHMNILWEMAAAQEILTKVLEKAKGLIHGVTCGAGMPYKLSEICSKFGVYYYPIISSSRAFNALWKRAYHKFRDFLGAVVYEDPWRAGGHNGLSNSEDPKKPEDPYPRIKQLRETMNAFKLNDVPIVIAGGVWYLRDWEEWISDPKISPVAFQFGTRALLTKESPISNAWKKILSTLKKGDVTLHRFSPTGFYSSAVRNNFIKELEGRSDRQIAYTQDLIGEHNVPFENRSNRKVFFITAADKKIADEWVKAGFTEAMATPESTLIFVDPAKAKSIRTDQINCMGCLSACKFSNWSQNETHTTGKKADPRSFCIQKTLQSITHDCKDLTEELMFAGHAVYKFSEDPFYKNNFIPTVKQLVKRILTGD